MVVSKEIHQLVFEGTDLGTSAVEHQHQNEIQPVYNNSTSTVQQLASSVSAWIHVFQSHNPASMPYEYRPDEVVKLRHQMEGRGLL